MIFRKSTKLILRGMIYALYTDKTLRFLIFRKSTKLILRGMIYALYMNGYNGGYYNIIVTQFEPDDLPTYFENDEFVYDKNKMNGKYQVGSGRVVTVTHDTPFIDDIVTQSETENNGKNVNNGNVQYSDKDYVAYIDKTLCFLIFRKYTIIFKNKKTPSKRCFFFILSTEFIFICKYFRNRVII